MERERTEEKTRREKGHKGREREMTEGETRMEKGQKGK